LSVDHYSVGDGSVGPLTRKLQEIYFNVVKGGIARYHGWLTPVYQQSVRFSDVAVGSPAALVETSC
jgi:hypothetical protein